MRRLCCLGALLALSLLTIPAVATPIMPAAEVRAGMTGYGLSVFKGTKIERFRVKVLGVLKNAFPKMDMILIRCSGANLEHSGIVAGMSGSPIYLQHRGQARLIGALAYGWTFSKDPIAGVTPIENMLSETKRPLRRPLVALGKLLDHPQLKRAATPLYMSGVVGSVLRRFAPQLQKWNFLPLQGGGAPPAEFVGKGPDLVPGAAVGVQLVSGDLSMTAVCTVTYRDKDTVLACGHPMLGIGEVKFPLTNAYVHHTFAGLSRSFKMAGAIRQVGTLIQDRRPTIVGRMGAVAPTVPLRIEVDNPMAKRRDVYRMKLVRHKDFTPLLTMIAMLNSVQTSASDQTDVSFQASLELTLEGHKPIRLHDHVFSPSGVLGFGLFGSPVFRALQRLYNNPFMEVRPRSLAYKIRLLFKRDLERIEAVTFDTEALTPGKTARATLRMRPYLGKPYERSVEFFVPESLEGRTISLHFAGGTRAPVDRAPPERFADLVRNLGIRHPSKSVVVTIGVPTQSFKFRGQNLTDLPRTILDAFNPANASGLGLVTGGIQQTVIPTQRVVVGTRGVRMRVKALDE